METMRDLINRAYFEGKVIGAGGYMSQEELSDGLDILNLILLQLEISNIQTVTKLVTGTGNGTDTVTIGQMDSSLDELIHDYTIDPTPATDPTIGYDSAFLYYPTEGMLTYNPSIPDIEVDNTPEHIDTIYFKTGNSRDNKAVPVSAGRLYDMKDVSDVDQYPSAFYYERTGYGTEYGHASIVFAGAPSSELQLLYTSSTGEIDANTLTNFITKAQRPFVIHSLAADLADENGLENAKILKKAETARRAMKRASGIAPTANTDSSVLFNRNGSGNSLHNHDILARGW